MMYSMKEVCERCKMPSETLKFYCNQGLIPNVKRDKNNRRVFDERTVAWIESLGCLKDCGMSIKEMKEYVDLCLQGQTSIPTRQEILAQKRKSLAESIAKLQESIDYIDRKQQFYADVLAGKIPYRSNLIPIESGDE